MTRGRALAGVLALLLVILGLVGYWAYLGYFSSQVFFPLAASRPPNPQRRGVVAVILSGDMGFKVGMSPQIAARLTHDGIPVVGVNSLTYFRDRRTPAQAAELIERAMARALELTPKGASDARVVLIGQSFGGDMVNVASPNIAPQWRRRLLAVDLIVPTNTIDFRASPAELLELVAPDESALGPGAKLGWVPTLCIYGRAETQSLCPHLKQPGVRVVALAGGHRLNDDANVVYATLMNHIEAALAARARITNTHQEAGR